MATPIGTNAVTSIARRHIMPEIVDNIYNAHPLTFRLYAANKRIIRGGTQIEVPLMYSRFAAGGAYQGFDLLDVSPSDTLLNGAWDWKQLYVPVTVDGLTLIKTDSPEAIADFIRTYFTQAEMEMAELIADGIWSDGTTNTKKIDGLQLAVDSTGTYGGLARATYTWWAAQENATGGNPTFATLQTLFGECTNGGRHPTIILCTQAIYNVIVGLGVGTGGDDSFQRMPVGPMGADEQLFSAGFTNILFNGVPVTVDAGASGYVYMLNEEFIDLAVSPRADFYLEDFQKPVQQDAMTAKLLWAGNLIVKNCTLQGKDSTS